MRAPGARPSPCPSQGAIDEAIPVFAARRRRPAAPRPFARARRHRRRRRPRLGPCRRRLHGREHAPGRAGGRALHVGGLQLVPARRSLALEAEGRPDGGRPRLPRRLLGPARLEGSLRQRRVHGAPGGAAGEQRRPLQLHAAGRRRRSRPHRLVTGDGGGAGASGRRRRRRPRPPGRPLRRHGHARRARRSGWPPTGRSPSRATSPPSRRARTKARRCTTTSSFATTSRCRPGRCAAAPPRR